MDDTRRREWVPLLKQVEPVPRAVRPLGAPSQLPPPQGGDRSLVLHKPPVVARDSVVGVVATKHAKQPLVLVTDSVVTLQTAHFGDTAECTAHPGLRRLPLHDPESPSRLAPVVGEAEKVEALGTPAICVTVRTVKPDQPSLVRVQAQAEAAEPHRQDLHNPASLSLVLDHHHGVISEAHQLTAPPQPRLDLSFSNHVSSTSCRYTVASIGEITPPCGLPASG